MAVAQPDGSAATITSASSITVTRTFTASAGDFLVAFWSGNARVTSWPPGWIVDGRWFGSGLRQEFGHRVASASEPATYTWTIDSTTYGTVLVDRYTGFAARQENCLLNSMGADAAASSASLAIPRIVAEDTNNLIIYGADNNGSSVTRFSSGVTLAGHNTAAPAMGWELASNTLVTARTATYSPASTNRIVSVVGYYAGLAGAGSPTAHTSLSGTGSISVTSLSAIQVHLTTLPARLGTGLGNPTRYFEVGNVAFGSGGYYGRNFYIEHDQELILMPFAFVDTIKYSFASGIVATITELP